MTILEHDRCTSVITCFDLLLNRGDLLISYRYNFSSCKISTIRAATGGGGGGGGLSTYMEGGTYSWDLACSVLLFCLCM